MPNSNYVPFSRSAADQQFVNAMGFKPVALDGVYERVYERPVITKLSHWRFPYKLRIYSTVDVFSGMTRDCASDSIKVVVIDEVTKKPVDIKFSRVNRTKNGLSNARERAREAFKWVLEAEKCPKCGAVMVQKTNHQNGHKFWSCSRFSPNQPYHCTGAKNV